MAPERSVGRAAISASDQRRLHTPWRRGDELRGRRGLCWRGRRLRSHWASGPLWHLGLLASLFREELVEF